MSEPIYHVAVVSEWEAALITGEYRRSTREQSLDEVGFIHCASAAQLAGVIERHYTGIEDPLVLLVIDPERLRHELRFDLAEAVGESFPHIYGPLNVDAVVETRPMSEIPQRIV